MRTHPERTRHPGTKWPTRRAEKETRGQRPPHYLALSASLFCSFKLKPTELCLIDVKATEEVA